MEKSDNGKDNSFNRLLDLGTKGHFPLFRKSWISEVTCDGPKRKPSFSKLEETKIKSIITRLSRHKRIDQKVTILMSLKNEDRNLFIKAFLKKVEHKILNNRPELH